MKRSRLLFGIILPSIVSLLVFTACPKPKDDPNPCCKGLPALQYKVDSVAALLTFYNVFTPGYYAVCDSLLYDSALHTYTDPTEIDGLNIERCTYEEAEKYLAQGITDRCPCRSHPREGWNDDVNGVFEIDGLENFPCNKLSFLVPGDTAKIRSYEVYNPKDDAFTGMSITDSTPVGRTPIERMLKSGEYEFELILFTDGGCEKRGNTASFYPDSVLDTIRGNFCIVRSGYPNSGCNAKNPADSLLN